MYCWDGLRWRWEAHRWCTAAGEAGHPAVDHSPLKKALQEGWVQELSSRRRHARHVYTRLTADAVAFFPEDPTLEATQPVEVLLLSRVSCLLGRGKGYVRIIDVHGHWWEFRPEPPGQVEAWCQAIAGRLEYFRSAVRQVSGEPQKGHTADLSAALQEIRRRRRRQRIANLLPCCTSPHVVGQFSTKVSRRISVYRGARDGHGNLVVDARLRQVTDPDLMEAQASVWSNAAVDFLRGCGAVPEELRADFALAIRMGVPDGLKRLIWPLTTGAALDPPAGTVEAKALYAGFLSRAFGDALPSRFEDPVPTFCQGIMGCDEAPPLRDVVKNLWLLTEAGEHALRRLLWTIQLTSHTVEFCPFLPNWLAMLLAFFSEAEAMILVSRVIAEAEQDLGPGPAAAAATGRLVCNRMALNKQAKLFVNEAQRRAPEVVAHLEALGLCVHAVAAQLLQDGLAHALSFRSFARLVGSFMMEGSDVILRYGLALFLQQGSALADCKTVEQADALLKNLGSGFGDGPEDVEKLSKAAFSIHFRGIDADRISAEWGSKYIEPSNSYPRRIFCRPRLFEPRGSCPDELWEQLWSWVPSRYRIFDPRLIYLPVMHGTSLRTCLQACKKSRDSPMLFFVYTPQGDIIGGFSPVMWDRSTGYLDLSCCPLPPDDAFAFRRLRGARQAEVYWWSGANGMLLRASDCSGLAFGGDGAAINIGASLTSGSTSASASFGSPSLLPAAEGAARQEVDFEIARFEVFALA